MSAELEARRTAAAAVLEDYNREVDRWNTLGWPIAHPAIWAERLACGFAATLHQLRHRFGTAAYDVDHDLRVVQELMGHATPATTALYAAISSASAVATVQALPAPRHLRAVCCE